MPAKAISSNATRCDAAASRSQPAWGLLFVLLATALAGFLDAVGYVELNHLYVSFMSGNSTHFGMTLAVGDWADVARAGSIIGAFVAGCLAGTLVFDNAGRPLSVLLSTEIAVCLVAIGLSALGRPIPALTLIAAAMGMQNVAHRNIAGTDAGKGFISGTLFDLGQALARLNTRPGGWRHAGVHALSWLSFIIGVACGALSIAHWHLVPSLALACCVMFFMLVLVLVYGSSSDCRPPA